MVTGDEISSDITLIDYAALTGLLQAVFVAAGASPSVASVLAANCAACERDGALSHGIFRIPGYVESIRTGWVDPAAVPQVEIVGDSFIRVDAMNGFAQPALALATDAVLDSVSRNGAAILAIHNSHHFSALWPDVEPFAERGLLALSMVNSFRCTVPFGAQKAVFGTNPIAFAVPSPDGIIAADLATSAMANGDLQIAAREGRQLPPDHGVDRDGKPTTDPKAVLDGGALLPFGGYKGSAISLMIELFCAGLTGGKFSFEVDWSAHPGAQTPHTGQFMLVIDPDRGRVPGSYAGRASQLVSYLAEAGVGRLPGQRRHITRERTLREGIPIRASDLLALRTLTADSESRGT